MLYADEAGQPVGASTSPGAPIYKLADPTVSPPLLAAVTDPGGAPVTWGDFSRGRGAMSVTCVDGGTRVRLELEGLIPGAVYTGWVLYFAEPGFAAAGFDALTGYSALGPVDGSSARFDSDASGRGSLQSVVSGGDVGIPVAEPAPSVPDCLLDAFEFHVIAAYHIDGRTHGASEGPPDVVAEHVDFPIVP
jgi:hypothetical protein